VSEIALLLDFLRSPGSTNASVGLGGTAGESLHLKKIVVTGGMGVLGSSLVPLLKASGFQSTVVDSAAAPGDRRYGDILDTTTIQSALADASGIIHLAAVSRVAWGEADPTKCWRTNIEGTQTVIDAALSAPQKIWMIFVSSREVYGNPTRPRVIEDDPIAPVNVYGRSKAAGEVMVARAREEGLAAACVRLPSVYGSPNDFTDRIVPSVVGNAVRGTAIELTGADQVCDFLHFSDALNGILRIAHLLDAGSKGLPPIHLASGLGVSLRELAVLVKELARSRSLIIEKERRPFDVQGFVGDPSRAEGLLGWKSRVSLDDGLRDMISRVKAVFDASNLRKNLRA
jgi:nucleoside-diphosphate-sugar epimerase